MWYKDKFGIEIKPYQTKVEENINISVAIGLISLKNVIRQI